MFDTDHNKTYAKKRKGNSAQNTSKDTKNNTKKTFKPPKKITEKYLYNSGLAYLQRFPASTHHFKTVMMRKITRSCAYHKEQKIEDCAILLDKTAAEFQRLGLLDDDAYLRGMVNSLRRRGQSAMAIQAKLSPKGFSRDAVAHALSRHDEENLQQDSNSRQNHEGELVAALILIRKKRLGAFDKREKYTAEKSLAVLARNGFSYDIAQKALAHSQEEIENKIFGL